MKKPIFIAEIKTQSPFGFKSGHTFVALMNMAIRHGDWVSVHTNALWGGDYNAISLVRKNTTKPILAKGIHATDDDIERAIDHGADYVLVVDRIPTLHLLSKCLLEFSNMDDLVKCNELCASSAFSMKYVYNMRDIKNGLPRKINELNDYIGEAPWLCQASGIRSFHDVFPMVDAFIVGEHLPLFCDGLL